MLAHVMLELRKHAVGEHLRDHKVPPARVVDEPLHVIHQLGVLPALVRNPVLEGVVVDGSNVPRRHAELHGPVGADAGQPGEVRRPQLVHEHLVVVRVPHLAVDLDLVEERGELGEEGGDLAVVGADDKVVEALLECDALLDVAVARGGDLHAVCPLQIPLQEELVRHAHRPLLGHVEGLEHVGRVSALDHDLHAKGKVHPLPPDPAVLLRDRRVRVGVELGHVFPVAGHVRREDNTHDHCAEVGVFLGGEAGEEVNVGVEHELKGAEGMVLLEDTRVIVQSDERRPRPDEEKVVDPRVLEVVAQRRGDEREALHRRQAGHQPALTRQAVGRLRHVENVRPVVVRVVKHAVPHPDDEPLQLRRRDPDVLGDPALLEDLQHEVRHVVGVEAQGVALERLEERPAALELLLVALGPDHGLLLRRLDLGQGVVVCGGDHPVAVVVLIVLRYPVLLVVGGEVARRGNGGGWDGEGRARGAAGCVVVAGGDRAPPARAGGRLLAAARGRGEGDGEGRVVEWAVLVPIGPGLAPHPLSSPAVVVARVGGRARQGLGRRGHAGVLL
mmetsp:Transcript_8833/g.21895  ORF Transcript_8833/g.21895 Transcript_8833/m.21895 type:complete len:559 (-) Transcript_8833:234-1910(-)